HIHAETRDLFAAAGLETFHFSTFEFPPPQSSIDRVLNERGELGRKAVDLIEVMARTIPLVNRLGCHLFMLARKTAGPVAPAPPAGVWPGRFSAGRRRQGSADQGGLRAQLGRDRASGLSGIRRAERGLGPVGWAAASEPLCCARVPLLEHVRQPVDGE